MCTDSIGRESHRDRRRKELNNRSRTQSSQPLPPPNEAAAKDDAPSPAASGQPSREPAMSSRRQSAWESLDDNGDDGDDTMTLD